jgi:hypothetical protein
MARARPAFTKYWTGEKGKKEKSQQKRRATAPVAPFPICQVDAAENGSRNPLCIVHVTHRGKENKKKEEEEIEKETPAHTHSTVQLTVSSMTKQKGKMRKPSSSSSSRSPGHTARLTRAQHLVVPFFPLQSNPQSNQAFICPP